LDIGPSALTRVAACIAPLEIENPPNLLLVNFGVDSSYLTVVWGRRLMLDRPIEFSEQRLIERLAAVLDMAPELARALLCAHGFESPEGASEAKDITSTLKEVLRAEFAAFAEQVNKTLLYTGSKMRGRTVDQVYAMGAIAHYPGISMMLQELLARPVELLNPFSIFTHSLSADTARALVPHSAIAIAAGLSLRDIKEAWPISI
jgi:Tfp pilus assembly PilM family ATPase